MSKLYCLPVAMYCNCPYMYSLMIGDIVNKKISKKAQTNTVALALSYLQ